MKKIILSVVVFSILSSCTQTSNGVNAGGIFTYWNDRNPTTNAVIDNSINPTKEGSSCVVNVLGLVAYGDSSIEEAKQTSGITKIAFVDRKLINFNFIIPIFAQGCTVIRGN